MVFDKLLTPELTPGGGRCRRPISHRHVIHLVRKLGTEARRTGRSGWLHASAYLTLLDDQEARLQGVALERGPTAVGQSEAVPRSRRVAMPPVAVGLPGDPKEDAGGGDRSELLDLPDPVQLLADDLFSDMVSHG